MKMKRFRVFHVHSVGRPAESLEEQRDDDGWEKYWGEKHSGVIPGGDCSCVLQKWDDPRTS